MAIDYCGNESVAIKTISISDTTAPIFEEAPEDITINCSEDIPAQGEVIVSDDCSDFSVTFNETSTAGDCPQESTITRTWTATDACGNSSQHVQVIHVVDEEAPEFTFVPANLTIQCDEALPTEMPEAMDNCAMVTISEEQEIIPTDCDSEYTLIRTFTAEDECGNSSQAQQVVTVVDESAPVLSDLPADQVIDCNDEVPAPPVLTASDNCDGGD